MNDLCVPSVQCPKSVPCGVNQAQFECVCCILNTQMPKHSLST